MKNKFVLIIFLISLFLLSGCQSNDNNLISSTINNLTYELGESKIDKSYDSNAHYLNVCIPIKNTSNVAVIPAFNINYRVETDSFSKKADVYPYCLSPNETGYIKYEVSSTRAEIEFDKIELTGISEAKKINLDILESKIDTVREANENNVKYYDVLRLSIDTKKFKDFCIEDSKSKERYSCSTQINVICKNNQDIKYLETTDEKNIYFDKGYKFNNSGYDVSNTETIDLNFKNQKNPIITNLDELSIFAFVVC